MQCKYLHKPKTFYEPIVGKVVGPAVFDPNDSTLVVTHFETHKPDSDPIWSLALKMSNGQTVKFDHYEVNSTYALRPDIKLIGITAIYNKDDNCINNLVLQFADG